MGSTKFDEFCEALDKPVFGHPDQLGLVLNETMFYNAQTNMVTLPDGLEFDLSVLNYAKYIKEVCYCPSVSSMTLNLVYQNYVTLCPVEAGATIEQVSTYGFNVRVL